MEEDHEAARELEIVLAQEIHADVDRWFAHTPLLIAEELMQNARRLCGQSVEVSFSGVPGLVRFSIKRPSVKVEPEKLVVFDPSLDARIGLYSLARTGVVVRAAGWRLELSRDALDDRKGRLERKPYVEDVEFHFRLAGAETAEGRRELAAVFRRAAAPMLFTTAIDGLAVARYRPGDQLADHGGQPLYDDLEEAVVADWKVVVARFENGRSRWTNPPRHEPLPAHWITVALDVGGRVVRPAPADVEALHPALKTQAEGALLVLAEDRHVAVTPGYAAIVESLVERPRRPGADTFAASLGDDRGAVVDALVAGMARLLSRAARNSLRDGHPISGIASSAGYAIPPRQVAARRPRRRDRNTPSGKAATPFDDVLAETAAVIVEENGVVVHRDPARIADLSAMPPFGAALSEMLAAAGRREIVDELVEVDGRLEGLDRIVSVALVVDGRTCTIARERFDDAAIAAGWIGAGLPRFPTIVSRLALVLERDRGRPLTSRLSHACVDLGAGVAAVVTTHRDLEALASSISRVVDRHRGDAGVFLASTARRLAASLRERPGRDRTV